MIGVHSKNTGKFVVYGIVLDLVLGGLTVSGVVSKEWIERELRRFLIDSTASMENGKKRVSK